MIPASLLIVAAATRLADHGVGVWNPTGAYTTTDTGITVKTMPQSPDRIIALTVYDRQHSPNPALTDQLVRLQVRMRTAKGRPDAVDDVADLVDLALSGDHMDWSGLRITKAHRVSYLPMGADQNGREELSCNYTITLP